MRFTKLKRLISYGQHNNIELEAEIHEGETTEEADKMLIAEIHKLMRREHDYKLLLTDLSDLQEIVEQRLRQKESIDKEIRELYEKKSKIENWLEKFNIDPRAFNDDEIPF